MKDHNKDLQDGIRCIFEYLEAHSRSIGTRDGESQTLIKHESSFTQADDPLIENLTSDIQALVAVIQTAINENMWDTDKVQLRTINTRDVFKVHPLKEQHNLRAGLTQSTGKKLGSTLAIETTIEFKEMNERIKELVRSLSDMNIENQELATELFTLKKKMLAKEQEYLQSEKVI